MTWESVRLGEVARLIGGGTPSKARSEYWGDGVPWITSADIAEDGSIAARAEITPLGVAKNPGSIVPQDSVLLVIRTGVGKTALTDRPTAFSQDIVAFAEHPRLDASYLRQFLRSSAVALKRRARGATILGITRDDVLSLRTPLPPLPEQRRIAAILDEADALRALQRRSMLATAEVSETAFRELEVSLEGTHTVPLDDIATVGSGITKGRKTPNVPLSSVDYMTVANVQDKRLDLSVVKQIDVSGAELERYRLRRGDLLLTEGGDPDKLGRGAVWNDERADAIHQNHVFRVRLRDPALSPLWLSWEIGSSYGKRYFLRMAKQTTGIATINSTQLRAFPVRVPDAAAIDKFLTAVENVRGVQADGEKRSLLLDALFASLQHRAFRGEL